MQRKHIPTYLDTVSKINESKQLNENVASGKKMSSTAMCAKEIRERLKKEFPNQKFKITSKIFSGGDSVDVRWEDGISSKKVNPILREYQDGNFNGMIDMYEYDDKTADGVTYTAKYVMGHRGISDSINKSAYDIIEKLYSMNDEYEKKRYLGDKIRQILSVTDIPFGATEVVAIDEKKFFSTSYELENNIFTFNTESKPKPKPTENTKKDYTNKPSTAKENQEIEEIDDIQFVDYSEKAIAVIGNTYSIKDILKSTEIGARFNKFLNINGEKKAGWIIPKAKKEALINLIKNK